MVKHCGKLLTDDVSIQPGDPTEGLTSRPHRYILRPAGNLLVSGY